VRWETLKPKLVLTLEGDRTARLHGFVRPDLFELFGMPGRL
jgi:hypothetical protein